MKGTFLSSLGSAVQNALMLTAGIAMLTIFNSRHRRRQFILACAVRTLSRTPFRGNRTGCGLGTPARFSREGGSRPTLVGQRLNFSAKVNANGSPRKVTSAQSVGRNC